MLFSIFTPTHNASHLLETYRSLQKQSFKDWEWVIVPNGTNIVLPEVLLDDKRVKTYPAEKEISNKGIGALKHYACQQCRGEYFVELDHDDLLTNNALAEIAGTIEKNPGGFYYSDFVNFREDGSCEVFDMCYGWKSYPFHYEGRDYTAMRAFETNAVSLHLIFYAPNHVRVWYREAYWKVGGHSDKLHVVDDFDLICRTYLAGVAFYYIPQCLYLYRLHGDKRNSYLKYNDDIQCMQQELSNNYVYRLIAEWCRRENLLQYDLGGRISCPEGFLSIDLQDADIVCDIRHGLPFADSSVGCIRASDFLEHIPNCYDSSCQHGKQEGELLCTVGVMNEIYRVLAPNGWLISATPSTDGRGAFQDPTHVSFWNPNSFWYYTDIDVAKYVKGINCRFQATRLWQGYASDWCKEHDILHVHADMVAIKGQQQIGLWKI